MSALPMSIPTSTLPEKNALRLLLQDFLHRLDETPAVSVTGEQNVIACRFCEDNIVVWSGQQRVFSYSTYSLLRQFFRAPNMMLSKEDVRQDVLHDDDARDGTIRQCILGARKELLRHGFPYRIETITRKGYRLIAQ